MKKILAVLGLVLLAGCATDGANGCTRKDKSCGKKVADASVKKEVAQENEPTVESTAPSK